MTQFAAAWLEHQRRRFQRHNAHRWWRCDAERYRRFDPRFHRNRSPFDRKAYNSDQPRVPAGSPEGGQWTSDETGPGQTDPRVLSDATPDGIRPGAQLAQYRPPIRARFSGASPGQEARLAAVEAQANAAVSRVREIDANWRPTPSLTQTIEGAIAAAEGEEREARQRLAELTQVSPQRLIEAYREQNGFPDLFGPRPWSMEDNTVGVGVVDGVPVFGMNSGAPTYTASDRTTAERAVDILVEKYPNVMNTENIGQFPNNALYHAEATVLLRAGRESGGILADKTFEVHVDREMCDSCKLVLPTLGLHLGNPIVTFVDPFGFRRTMRDGDWLPRKNR